MTEHELNELTQICVSHAEQTLAIYDLFVSVVNELCDCPAEEWWSHVLMFSEEGQKNAMSIIGNKKILPRDFKHELIEHTQVKYNSIRQNAPEIWELIQNDIKKIKKTVWLPDSGFITFLDRKKTKKTTKNDLWLYFCFDLWLAIRTIEYSLNRYSSSQNTNFGTGINLINALFQSYTIRSIMYSGDSKRIEEIQQLNDLVQSPELLMYQMINEGKEYDYTKIHWLLACLFDIEDNQGSLSSNDLDIIEQCLQGNDVNVTNSRNSITRESAIRSVIEKELFKYFPHISVSDGRIRRIYADLQVSLNLRDLSEVESLYFVEFYENFYRTQLTILKEIANESIQFLFGLLHSGLFDMCKAQIASILITSKYKECIDSNYAAFLKKNPSFAKNNLFRKEYNQILKPNDLLINGERNHQTFKLTFGITKIQALYDFFINSKYISDDTDILSFAHMLTGLQLSDTHKFHEIKKNNWIAEKQSLAYFAGILRKDDDLKVNLSWREIANLFTYKGKAVPPTLHVDYRNAEKAQVKSNKYSELWEGVNKIIHPSSGENN